MQTVIRSVAVLMILAAWGCHPSPATRLTNADPAVRATAIRELMVNRETVKHLPMLLQCLIREDAQVQREAVLALNQLGSPGRAALVGLMSHPDASVRVETLRVVGSPSRKLPRHFTEDDDRVFFAPIVVASHDKSVVVRQQACEAIADVCIGAGKLSEGIARLTEMLDDPDAAVRAEAARAVGWIASKIDKNLNPFVAATQSLARRLTDQDERVRAKSSWALHEIGGHAKESISALIAAIESEQNQVALAEAESALLEIGSSHADAVSKGIVNAFKTAKSARSKCSLLFVVRRIKNKPDYLVPFLVGLLADNDRSVRQLGIMALADMGPQARQAVPALEALLHGSAEFRPMLALSVYKIAGKGELALAECRKALAHQDASVRCQAVEVLATLGSSAEPVIPQLRWMADHDPDNAVRSAALLALRQIGRGQ